MTRAPATTRYIHCIVCLILSTGCQPSRQVAPVTAVALIKEFDRAEASPRGSFAVSSQQVGDVSRASLVGPVPSRIIWPLPLPRRAVFRAYVAAAHAASPPMRLRVGVSDHRIYEGLADVTVAAGDRRWIEVRADLSAYAGRKWSVFYRPDRMTWRLVLSADAIGTSPAQAVWGLPEILTDTESALEFQARRRELSGS
jgi:hypothetical protein